MTEDPPPLPAFLDNAAATSAVSYLTLTHSRPEMMNRIGDAVGFTVEGNRDRLRKEELAQIAVYTLAVEGKL